MQSEIKTLWQFILVRLGLTHDPKPNVEQLQSELLTSSCYLKNFETCLLKTITKNLIHVLFK